MTQFTDLETDRLRALAGPPLLLHDKANTVGRPQLAALPELDHKQFYRLVDASDNTDKIPADIVADAKACQELRVAAIDARGAYLELDAVDAATLHVLDYEAKVEGQPATAYSTWAQKLTEAHGAACEATEAYTLRVERFIRRLYRADESAYLPMVHAALDEPIVKVGAQLAAALAAAELKARELSEMVAIVAWFEVARANQLDGRTPALHLDAPCVEHAAILDALDRLPAPAAKAPAAKKQAAK